MEIKQRVCARVQRRNPYNIGRKKQHLPWLLLPVIIYRKKVRLSDVCLTLGRTRAHIYTERMCGTKRCCVDVEKGLRCMSLFYTHAARTRTTPSLNCIMYAQCASGADRYWLLHKFEIKKLLIRLASTPSTPVYYSKWRPTVMEAKYMRVMHSFFSVFLGDATGNLFFHTEYRGRETPNRQGFCKMNYARSRS